MKNRGIIKIGAAIIVAALCVPLLSGCGRDNGDTAENGSVDSTVSRFDAENDGAQNNGTENDSTEGTPGAEMSKSPVPAAESTMVPAKTQSMIDDARSFLNAGMYEDAEEMLGSIDSSELTAAERAEYEAVADQLASVRSEDTSETFTPQQALSMVEEKYGLNLGDNADGLAAESDADGRMYYPMLVQVDSENQIKDIRVYKDGIVEVSSEPLSFG